MPSNSVPDQVAATDKAVRVQYESREVTGETGSHQ